MSGMKGESFIRKIQSDPDGLDFDGLRKEGIRLVQEMCGSTWTDYNLHDPGVTMLEQLCYGLTDLAYRAGFSVEDLLADENGEIDYGQLGLYRPDDAFSCGPVTANDYRRIILDAVPNVDNAWVEMQDGAAGLYRVHLQLNERVQEQDSEGARKAYADIVRKLSETGWTMIRDPQYISVRQISDLFLLDRDALPSQPGDAKIHAWFDLVMQRLEEPRNMTLQSLLDGERRRDGS